MNQYIKAKKEYQAALTREIIRSWNNTALLHTQITLGMMSTK
jgi:hypothetical protein